MLQRIAASDRGVEYNRVAETGAYKPAGYEDAILNYLSTIQPAARQVC